MAITIDVGKIKLVWRGTYSGSTAYTVDDLVVYDDGSTISSYICITNTTGNVPSTTGTVNTTYWNIVAKGASAAAAGTVDGQVQYKSSSGFAATTGFIYDISNNRVGIATTSPRTTLDVSGTITATNATISSINITGISTFSNILKVTNTLEKTNIVAGTANATANIDVKTSNVWLFTSNSAATWTHNIRGDASTSLDSLMSIGEILSVTVISKQNNTSYYSTDITIDSASQTEFWITPGTAPINGNTTGYDIYTWTITKTASSTFIVTAGKSEFS